MQHRPALVLLVLAALALLTACPDIEYTDPATLGATTPDDDTRDPGGSGGDNASGCDPDQIDACFCLDATTGDACERGAANCVCDEIDNSASPCDPRRTVCTCTDVIVGLECDPDTSPPGTCFCDFPGLNSRPANNAGGPVGWRFVLIEDQLDPAPGEYPGTDIDAIELRRARGDIFFATTVEDFQLGGGIALDVAQALGQPDAGCDAESGRFVSLGGRDAGGYIIVGFSSAAQDVTFRAGSIITVYELGTSLCGQYDDDPYAIAVSVSSDRATFTQIGAASGAIPVSVTVNP